MDTFGPSIWVILDHGYGYIWTIDMDTFGQWIWIHLVTRTFSS